MDMRWILTTGNLSRLRADGVPLDNAYVVSSDPVLCGLPPGSTCTPVLTYKAFAQFEADVKADRINPVYGWVMYDCEAWGFTPTSERQNPWLFMREFGQLAHSKGYRVILAPARDLADVPGSVQPKSPGESTDHWYLATDIAGQAAYADLFLVQSEMDEKLPAAYASLVNGAVTEALSHNPFASVFAEVATTADSAAQMIAAAKQVEVDGFYLSIADGNVAAAKAFIEAMTASAAKVAA